MPDGFRSLAFRVTYRSEDRTLTDEELAGMHERVRSSLEQRFGAQLTIGFRVQSCGFSVVRAQNL